MFKDLIGGLIKFFKQQKNGETLVQMLPLLMEAKQGKEIAQELEHVPAET